MTRNKQKSSVLTSHSAIPDQSNVKGKPKQRATKPDLTEDIHLVKSEIALRLLPGASLVCSEEFCEEQCASSACYGSSFSALNRTTAATEPPSYLSARTSSFAANKSSSAVEHPSSYFGPAHCVKETLLLDRYEYEKCLKDTLAATGPEEWPELGTPSIKTPSFKGRLHRAKGGSKRAEPMDISKDSNEETIEHVERSPGSSVESSSPILAMLEGSLEECDSSEDGDWEILSEASSWDLLLDTL